MIYIFFNSLRCEKSKWPPLNPSYTRPSSYYNVKPARRNANLCDVKGTQ